MKSADFGTPGLRISGFVSRCGWLHVVEAEAALDAQPLVVRRTVAPFDVNDLVVLDVVRELAADAAVRAHRRRPCLSIGCRHASCAGASAPVGHACTHSPQATHVDTPIGSSRSNTIFECVAAERVADDVVDLLLAARAHAARALDARVEVHRHRRMRQIGRGLLRGGEARLADRRACAAQKSSSESGV